MGRGNAGDLRDELIILAPPSDLIRFGAGTAVTEPGRRPCSPSKPGIAEAREDRPGGVREQTLEMEVAVGTRQAIRPGHPAELVWGRGCSPGLEARLSQPQHPLTSCPS